MAGPATRGSVSLRTHAHVSSAHTLLQPATMAAAPGYSTAASTPVSPYPSAPSAPMAVQMSPGFAPTPRTAAPTPTTAVASPASAVASQTRAQRLEQQLHAAQDMAVVVQAERAACERGLEAEAGAARRAAHAAQLQAAAAEQRGEALALQVSTLQESLALAEAGRQSAVQRCVVWWWVAAAGCARRVRLTRQGCDAATMVRTQGD